MTTDLNPAVSPVLAYALMPGESFAQKRADNLMMLQVQQLRKQQLEQDLAQKDKALADTEATLDLIKNQGLLPVSTARLNSTFTERWRQQMENELVNDFGGDIVRFRRERQPYLAKRFANELIASQEYKNAMTSKTNYALAQEAISKGKVIMGNFDRDWQAFNQSPTEIPLSFAGAYEPPKGVLSYFDENTNPVNPYKKVQVTAKDIFDRALNQGLSEQAARDYVQKLNYQGGRYWKVDQQKPWDAEKDRQDNAYRWSNLGEQKRHNRTMEANAAQANKLKAQEMAGGSGITPAEFIFSPDKGNTDMHTYRIGTDTIRVKSMPGGQVSEAVMHAAGISRRLVPYLPEDSEVPVNKSLYSGSVKQVYSLDFKRPLINTSKDGFRADWQIQDVDPSKVYYRPGGSTIIYGDGGEQRIAGSGYAGAQPFIKGIVIDATGLKKEVMIPLNTSELSAQQINSELGFGTTKAEAAQNNQTEVVRKSGLTPKAESLINGILSK